MTATPSATGGPVPCSVFGSLAAVGQSLRISASSAPSTSASLVFAGDGTYLAVRDLIVTGCSGAGTANATAMVAGTAGSPSKGGGVASGDAIVATLTVVGGSPGEVDITDTTAHKTFRMLPPYFPRSELRITSP